MFFQVTPPRHKTTANLFTATAAASNFFPKSFFEDQFFSFKKKKTYSTGGCALTGDCWYCGTIMIGELLRRSNVFTRSIKPFM
jgi:hypothetical protein